MENVCLPCLDKCRKRSLLICRRTSLVRGILSPSETHSEYINFMDLRNPSHADDKAGKVRSSWLWNLGHIYQKYKQHVSNPTKNYQWPLICKAISTPFQKCKTILRKCLFTTLSAPRSWVVTGNFFLKKGVLVTILFLNAPVTSEHLIIGCRPCGVSYRHGTHRSPRAITTALQPLIKRFNRTS